MRTPNALFLSNKTVGFPNVSHQLFRFNYQGKLIVEEIKLLVPLSRNEFLGS